VTFDTILFEAADGVATITLNRPARLNALTNTMFREIGTALDRVAANPALRCVLLTGAGRGFCAGADLAGDGIDADDDLDDALVTLYNPLVRRLQTFERPVVAAVNGVAAGAGCNLALACDIVIAGKAASFLQAFARIGLIPDAGGTYLLPRLVGRARAMGMALLAEGLPAETAAEWGLIWRCVADEALMTEAGALAAKLAQGPTRAYGLIKQAMAASLDNGLDEQLAVEARLQGEAGRSPDYAEGVAAFLEKRPARFTGR
jgi:2-(1,2-epoxy-1,2-dihydrophenyl)acetyl-CoA isomerase